MRNQLKKKKHALPSRPKLGRRMLAVSAVFIGGLIFMGVRVGAVMYYYGHEYETTILKREDSGEQEIPAQRGAIVDCNQKTLATSVLTYNVVLSPKAILSVAEDKRQIIYEGLAQGTGKDSAAIKKIVEEEVSPTSQYYLLAKNIEAEQAEGMGELGGVSLQKNYVRKYPKGSLAAQVLGYVNTEGQGKYGIEQQYQEYLEGVAGRTFSQYQDEGITTAETQSPQNGATITLTIDTVIQQYIANTMEKYIKMYEPINATCIIMNPNTGAILGMYSYPEYNPETYNNLSEQLGEEAWNALSQQEQSDALNEAWKNHAIQYTYEPGSTFKPLVVATALDEGAVTEKSTFNCGGNISVLDRTINCWKTAGHGLQTLEDVLANSCNVGMIEMTRNMDNNVFYNYVKRFGFGETTGIGLVGEEKGIMHQSLSDVDKATYSMGQSFNVTPLQLITGFSAVINGGYLLNPYLVSDIRSEAGEMLYTGKTSVRRQVISESASKVVTQYLQKVIDDGTGKKAAVTGYDIGGKTGTAQKGDRTSDKYVVSFMGFAPVSRPEVVGLVVFDNLPDETGAAPSAFKEMMENILPYMNIDVSVDAEALENEELGEVPDVAGKDIYTAISSLEQNEFNYDIVGVGNTVTSQYPKAGSSKQSGSTVKLYTSSENVENVVEVPNLIGLTLEEAKTLVDGIFKLQANGSGVVASQIPKAGCKIDKDSKIIVTTSQ